MAKKERIIELLEARIARGDYALTAFPPEVRLAEEIGVSRMTARRAILHLVENGWLARDASGRLAVTPQHASARPLNIGFLVPSVNSAFVRWRHATEQAVKHHNGHVRPVPFFHWDDPVLLEAIESFDGAFLVPPAEALPPKLAERFRTGRARLVVLDANYSGLGLHSVELIPPTSLHSLLDRMAELGHNEIAAFNTQPVDPVVEQRLEQWQFWLVKHGHRGQLINEPELSYGEPLNRAYQVARQRFASGQGMGGTAVLCITVPAAIGLMRAAIDSGLTVGRDISICAVNDEGMAPFLNPSLTAIRMPDPVPLLESCVDWMMGEPWNGPLLKQPTHFDIFEGESTGPVSTENGQWQPLAESHGAIVS